MHNTAENDGATLARLRGAPALSPIEHFAIEKALEREGAMLAAVACGEQQFVWAIWEADQCLVAPAAMRARIENAGAGLKSAQAGWPVHYRRTGGGVTPQGPGIINLSMAYALPRQAIPSIKRSYHDLCAPIVDALGELGCVASIGPVAGSFCDGAYNVIVDRRKFAGTAQRWTGFGRGIGRMAVLAHALMLIEPPSEQMIAEIDTLHGNSGIVRKLHRDVHVSLAELGLRTAWFTSALLCHLQARSEFPCEAQAPSIVRSY